MMAEQSITDVKENMQEIGDRIRGAVANIQVPVRVYQANTTAERRSGYYVEQFSLERFMEFIVRHYTGRGLMNTEPAQHLTALVNTVLHLRDQVTNDTEKLYTLVDQLLLLQERAADRAVAAALAKAAQERAAMQLPALAAPGAPAAPVDPAAPPAHLIAPIPPSSQSPELQAMGREMRELHAQGRELSAQIQLGLDPQDMAGVDLTGEPAATGTDAVPDEPDEDKPRRKQRGKDTSDEDLDEEDDDVE